MSTDSTELTFVRCPSCRSLVPAVSTRCRMCGSSLDAASETPSEADAEESSGRVRQRTMSKSKSDLSGAAEQLRDELTEAEDAIESMEGDAPQVNAADSLDDDLDEYDDGPLDDPLGDYLEKVDPEAAPVVEAKVSVPVEKKEEPIASVVEEPVEVPMNGNGDAEAHVAPKPSVRIESGTKRGGLSFGKRGEQSAPSAAKVEATPAPQPVVEQKVEKAQKSEGVQEKVPAQPKKVADKERAKEVPHKQEETRPEAAPVTTQSMKPSSSKAKVSKSAQSGRLYGWLVSYTNPDGEAVELREGKFFVTGSSLKETDMVLDHDSISTPHAMVSINIERGFEVQDLMSERGVHIRGRDDDTYRPEEEVVSVEHGDWIRFGDVEYLVTLIAHVGKA